MSDPIELLRSLLSQSVKPSYDPEECDACEAMTVHAAVVRFVSPLSAGSDLCPWHGGYETGRYSVFGEIEGLR